MEKGIYVAGFPDIPAEAASSRGERLSWSRRDRGISG
jgi:hypothetical protein